MPHICRGRYISPICTLQVTFNLAQISIMCSSSNSAMLVLPMIAMLKLTIPLGSLPILDKISHFHKISSYDNFFQHASKPDKTNLTQICPTLGAHTFHQVSSFRNFENFKKFFLT